jgi:hypothetical protein
MRPKVSSISGVPGYCPTEKFWHGKMLPSDQTEPSGLPVAPLPNLLSLRFTNYQGWVIMLVAQTRARKANFDDGDEKGSKLVTDEARNH